MTSLNLAELRQQLIESGTYLADPQLLDHVHWVPDGRRNVLVYNDELLGNDDADGGHVSGPAVLSAVVRVSDQSFWLTSDGGWRGPTDFTPFLHQVKATCLGIMPNEDVGQFHWDWGAAVDNAQGLQSLIATPDFSVRLGFVGGGNDGTGHLRFRHILFEVSLLLSGWCSNFNSVKEAGTHNGHDDSRCWTVFHTS